MNRRALFYRAVVALALLCGLIGGLVIARGSPGSVLQGAESIVTWIRSQGSLGLLVFLLLQMGVILSGIVPASLAAIAAGLIYGTVVGSAVSALATMAAACAAFFLSRSLFRPLIAGWMESRARLNTFDELVNADGWKVVCLLRLSPVMPFAAVSYMLGLSRIGLRAYVLGTLACLPALVGYVALGAVSHRGLAAWTDGATPLHWLILVGGGLATALLGIWLIRAMIRIVVER